MSEIAIIGAGGFVGASLIETLILAGHPAPRAIVRSYKSMAGLCRFGSAVDVRRANAENVEALAEAVEGARTVVNVTTGPPAGIVRSTRTIYEACVRAQVPRFVHLSSGVVYGDVPQPIDDDAPPVSGHWMPYARAKGAAEIWLRSEMPRAPLEIIVLRPGIVWGVRSPHTIDLARSLLAKNAYLVNDGRGIFNGAYIANLVAAIRAASDAQRAVPGFYNVGDRETVTWKAFFAALGAPLGCDAERLTRVSSEQFPWSLASIVDMVQNLPGINEMYHRLKVHIPDNVKVAIRPRLEGGYSYERPAAAYETKPGVGRELWHLQRVAHKLPIDKFNRNFGFAPPVSFDEAIRRTVAWLATLGSVAQPSLLSQPGIANVR